MRIYAVNIAVTRLGVATALVALAGCATLFTPPTLEGLVKARSQDRRNAFIKGDLDRVYSYFSPGYRAAVTLNAYKASFGNAVQTIGAKVESVECPSSEKCIATVQVETKPLAVRRFVGTIISYTEETWLFQAGQWWYFQGL